MSSLNHNMKVENSSEDVDLKKVFNVFFRYKWLISSITLVAALISVVFAINQPNIYKSTTLIMPAEQESKGGLSSLASQFGGLASLAGMNIPSQSNKSKIAVEILRSRLFISKFINKHNLLPDLIAAEFWDLGSNKLSYNPDLYDAEMKRWVRKVQLPFTPKPTDQEAYKSFLEKLSIIENIETGMITISFDHISPYFAKNILDLLIEDINNEMKKKDIEEAKKSIAFLEEQIRKTSVSDIKSIFYNLIEEQTKTIMFAEVRKEYVFKVIDPAIVPELKDRPKRALICIFGTLLGFMLSLLIVFFLSNIKGIYSK
ncbi:Wzz/FepE/Etk N-terminal domain-containing protein [Pseudoalteromonas elyakovii]|nr:Wzz/FepE/Etk N-terminal domain-containing protein [Pseudoalteromonas elyakovii]